MRITLSTGTPAEIARPATGDPWCPPADMDDVEAAGVTVLRYEGAGHGWAHAPDRDSYRPTDAADAWRRAEEFLTAP